jgi:uncharacterized membrane protein
VIVVGAQVDNLAAFAFGGRDEGGKFGASPSTFVGGSNPLLYKHHRGECRFNGGMFGGMVRTLKTPSGMTGVGPSIERVQMFQSPSDVIQLALTPVFLLTALAALLNVFSTRLGRVADRVDLLSADLQRGAADTEFLSAQLDFLHRRSLILDVAVVLATVGGAATCAAALVLFFGTLGDAEFRILVFGLFGGAIIFTITALVTFAIEMIMAGLGLRSVVRTMKTADQNKSDPKTC